MTRPPAGRGELVDVALPLPVHQTFTYRMADGRAPPLPGTRVLVPFGRGERVGWVVGPASGAGLKRIRSVLDVLEDRPSLTPEIFRLCGWVSDYYLGPPGITYRTALPAVLSDASRDYLSMGTAAGGGGTTPREQRLLGALASHAEPVRVRTLADRLDMGSIWPEIRTLSERGLVRHRTVPPREPTVRTRKVVRITDPLEDLARRETLLGRAQRQRDCFSHLEAAGGAVELAHLMGTGGFSHAVVRGLERKGIVESVEEESLRDPFHDRPAPEPAGLTPTPDQSAVLEGLLDESLRSSPRPCLLHGITGSGKTLVYIHLLKEIVERRGRSALVLVPEIALTPQTVSRFRSHFGTRVAVLHSGLSDGERYDAWRDLRRGGPRIAVGARSAVFAPLDDLGAIVVDEEHDSSYKQSESPRYHARDLAVVRAGSAGAICVLGSATPSLESWENSRRGKFRLFTLPERATGASLPPVRVVDLRTLRGEDGRGGARRTVSAGPAEGETRGEGGTILSAPLRQAIEERLRKEEQTILLLNRRGYSSFIQCRECGDVRSCEACSVSLTFHRVTGRLLCHHCRHEEPAPRRCSRCGSDDLSFRGLGTEQVERSVAGAFPGARIARMDVDTTSGKWAHHEILGRVERREVDILLGTQMIAKGLDFARVTLVGVVNADVGLHLPDFRASERTFQLLSQVAGRAGRGERGGEVILQTSVPEHYAIRAALSHDFPGFARREIAERGEPGYPPHLRLANVVLSSPDPEAAANAAETAARWVRERWIRSGGQVELVGPAPCPIERLHHRWRWHFLLRSRSVKALGEVCRGLVVDFRPPSAGDVRLALDRDPVALL